MFVPTTTSAILTPSITSVNLSPTIVKTPYGQEIITLSASSDDYVTTPIVTSVDFTYTTPAIGSHESLNFSPETRERIVKYFRDKIIDKWASGDLKKLLGSKSKEQLKENIITKNFVHKVLTKYSERTRTNWVDMPHKSDEIKKVFKHEIAKKMNKKKDMKGGKHHHSYDGRSFGYNMPIYSDPYMTSPVDSNDPPVVAVGSATSPFIALTSPSYPMNPSVYQAIGDSLPRPVTVLSPVSVVPNRNTVVQYNSTFVPTYTPYTLGTISYGLRNRIISLYPQVNSYPLTSSLYVILAELARQQNMTALNLFYKIINS